MLGLVALAAMFSFLVFDCQHDSVDLSVPFEGPDHMSITLYKEPAYMSYITLYVEPPPATCAANYYEREGISSFFAGVKRVVAD